LSNYKTILKVNKELVISLFLLNLFIFSSTFEVLLGIPQQVKYLFSVTVIYFFISFFRQSELQNVESFVVKLIKIVFLIVSSYLLIGSFRKEIFYIQEIFAERFYFLPYLLPIIFLFIKYDLSILKYLIQFSYYLLPLALFVEVYIIIFTLDPFYYVQNAIGILTLSIAPNLLLFTSHLSTNKKLTLLSTLYFLLFAFILAKLGRRGETFENVFMLFWFLILRLGSKSINQSKKFNFFILSLILLFVLSFFVYQNRKDIYLFERGVSADGFDESRGETIDNFLYEYGREPNDYLYGRGLNGTFQKFSHGENMFSRSIEIGYLNIMWKGGLFYLVPMMLLFIISFARGFFKSNNDFVKGLAGNILWQIIYMASFGMANFATNYVLIWISVGICLDPRMRKFSNTEIVEFIKK
jgi:hypothetical protein